ncbi:MAG: hypothetical protein ACLU91_11320 [Oscillibacter sp.]|jgi:hypothetical protein
MNTAEFEKMLLEQDHQLLKAVVLPEHESLLQTIRALFPTTGILQNMFCNGFMTESVELIKHALFLYEDGYFDCAFYSLRQSVEIMNSMLLLSDDEDRLKEWKAKAWFPMDKAVKGLLEKNNAAYSEIREKIPEFFTRYDELLKKANKYIHKQGFDSFYAYYGWIGTNKDAEKDRTDLFVELMKHAIGMILIMDIALDPLSLALSDPEVDSHIPFDAMTEPIPVHMFEEFLSIELLNRIKETDHYQTIRQYFLNQEELNDATYGVRRYQFFDIHSLKDVEKQRKFLDIYEVLMLRILQAGIPATHFYTDYDILGYSTSITPKKHITHHSSNQFEKYISEKDVPNIPWNEMFISIFKFLDIHFVIQHDQELNDTDISTIKSLISDLNKQYQSLKDAQNTTRI